MGNKSHWGKYLTESFIFISNRNDINSAQFSYVIKNYHYAISCDFYQSGLPSFCYSDYINVCDY